MILTQVQPQSKELLQLFLEESAAQHKHLCPRQILGVRIGMRGLLELGLGDFTYQFRFDNSRKRLLTIVETDGCGADGVAVAVDCHVGRRTLRVLDYGKVAATFVDRQTGRAIRVRPAPNVRDLARFYTPDAKSRWHSYLEAYQIMPDEELLEVLPVQLAQPLEKIISRPRARVNCAQCGEEVMNEREVEVNGRLLCKHCAEMGYYTVCSAEGERPYSKKLLLPRA